MEWADRATGGRNAEFRMMNADFRKKRDSKGEGPKPPIASGVGLSYTISPFLFWHSAF
jgi:hypothetical protein